MTHLRTSSSRRFLGLGLVFLALSEAACSSGEGSGVGSGGTATVGGASSGGASSGGTTSGGSSSGGMASGGSSSGGSSSGGTSSGGASAGGAPSGGSSAGGAGGGAATGGAAAGGGSGDETLSFFVTSEGLGSGTGDLGGLAAADAHCQTLATAAGAGSKTWHAYLSVEADDIHAKDRIGTGPWMNALGETLASDVEALHALPGGDPDLFVDENGEKVPGQWAGSPSPNEHDIVTGSDPDGTANGNDCAGWTSTSGQATVGHSDGLGPSMNADPPYNSWNSSHTSGCNNFTPAGGAGRLYCFAID